MDEQPAYSEISEREIQELEAAFGHPLTRETALWLIRFKTHRDAIKRMLGEESDEQQPSDRHAAYVRSGQTGFNNSEEHDMDKSNLVQILKAELAFLEIGGYSMRRSRGPQMFLEGSPTCINYTHPSDRLPCNECGLMQFVPEEHRSEKRACRFIPLNPAGETLDDLYRRGNEQETEDTLVSWLRKTIDR